MGVVVYTRNPHVFGCELGDVAACASGKGVLVSGRFSVCLQCTSEFSLYFMSCRDVNVVIDDTDAD